jgi:hypothetical protein
MDTLQEIYEFETKLSDLADLLISWRLTKEDAEARTKTANEMIRKVESEIVAKMQEEEIDKFAHAGSLFSPRVESHPSVNKDTEALFHTWLEQNGEDGILRRTVHPSTLKAWYKQNADRFAEELTEKGLVKVYEEIRVSVRKA